MQINEAGDALTLQRKLCLSLPSAEHRQSTSKFKADLEYLSTPKLRGLLLFETEKVLKPALFPSQELLSFS